jgi:hypothetical protein
MFKSWLTPMLFRTAPATNSIIPTPFAVSKGILADHHPPRRNKGRKGAENEVAADTLSNHWLIGGSDSPEMTGFALLRVPLAHAR